MAKRSHSKSSQQNATSGGSDKSKKHKKSGDKKSINQLLGIGKPGPHLLKHNKFHDAKKKRRELSWMRKNGNTMVPDHNSQDYHIGSSTINKNTSIVSHSSSRQQSKPKPQHHHHILDHVAHTGTYLDEYDQDLQYEYSPDLWQKSTPSTRTKTKIPSLSQRHSVLSGEIIPPSADTQNSVHMQSAYSIKGVLSPPIQTTLAVTEPEASPPTLPSLEDLRIAQLEKIKERKNKRSKKKATVNEPESRVTTRTRRRNGPPLKGQDRPDRIEYLLNAKTYSLQQVTSQSEADYIHLNTNLPMQIPDCFIGSTTQKRRWSKADGDDTASAHPPPPECPWMRHRQYLSKPSAALLLNHEVKDFVAFLSPTQEEHRVRTYVFERVRRAIKDIWEDAEVKLFGSFETQLYLPTSDLDIVVFRLEAFTRNDLTQLVNRLERLKVGTEFEVLPYAKIPLVKFVESISHVPVDVSFNVLNGLDGAALTKRFMEDTPGLRSLTMLIKHFLKLKRLNETFHGGIGSFLTVIMVMSFLQMHPKVRSKWIDPEENLGVLLIEFFELYGLCFNYDKVGLTVTDGGNYFLKNKDANNQRHLCFCALDPNDPENDVGGGARNIARIRDYFASAFKTLVGAVESRHVELVENRYNINNPKVSLVKGVLNIPPKTLELRRHMDIVYSSGTFKQVMAWN
ncbi:hypothetical protein BGZ49_010324 [Haplosporangium sp. Z 27]|nr:hypothetical protein BGZ49_010324 [Haplosporangium sp. Z 27]